MRVIDRIKIFIDAEKLPKSQFERNVGLSNGYISNLKGDVGADKIAKILERYPNINETWLLTGNGDMYKSKDINNENGTMAIAQGYNNHIQMESDRLITLLENRDDEIKQRDRHIDELIEIIKKLTEKLTSK